MKKKSTELVHLVILLFKLSFIHWKQSFIENLLLSYLTTCGILVLYVAYLYSFVCQHLNY